MKDAGSNWLVADGETDMLSGETEATIKGMIAEINGSRPKYRQGNVTVSVVRETAVKYGRRSNK